MIAFVRGGSWLSRLRGVRASYRSDLEPAYRFDHVGVRCVRSQPYAVRGGSWFRSPRLARASNRYLHNPTYRRSRVKIRCVRKVGP